VNRRVIGLVFVGLLGALVAHNVVQAVRNRDLDCDRRPCRAPRDVAKVAARDEKPIVRGRFAYYYQLADRIPGASVTLFPGFADEQVNFERYGGVHAEVSAEPLLIQPRYVRRLRLTSNASFDWAVEVRRRRRPKYRPLYSHFQPGERDYVLATEANGAMYLLPRAVFEQHREPAATGAPP
jgi:hypothetical protein